MPAPGAAGDEHATEGQAGPGDGRDATLEAVAGGGQPWCLSRFAGRCAFRRDAGRRRRHRNDFRSGDRWRRQRLGQDGFRRRRGGRRRGRRWTEIGMIDDLRRRRRGNRRPWLAPGPHDAHLGFDRGNLGGGHRGLGYGRRNIRIDGGHGRGHRNRWFRPWPGARCGGAGGAGVQGTGREQEETHSDQDGGTA